MSDSSGGSATPLGRSQGLFRAFHHRNYRLFFFGQSISLIGTWMQMVAQSWLVYRLTGSAALLGVLGFCGQIPVFLFASIGGAFADRHNRHRILIFTQAASMVLAFALAALTLTGTIREWHLFVLASMLGLVNALDFPVRQSFVVDMVGKEDLGNAIALNSSIFNSARIIGPAVAGILVGWIGEGWCFFANAASYIAVIAGLLCMRAIPRGEPRRGTAWRSIVEGYRFVAHTRPIRVLMIQLGFISLLGMPYAILMPIFADRILRGGPKGFGFLVGSAGIGALIGAVRMAMRKGTDGLGRSIAITTASFGVSLILFSFSRTFWLSAALLVPVGFSMMTAMASSNTLVQTIVPDRLRGRVMAVHSMMFMGMAPFGSLYAGALAQRIGAPLTVAIGGVACIVIGCVFWRQLPRFKEESLRMIE
jgi:MFS family permease